MAENRWQQFTIALKTLLQEMSIETAMRTLLIACQ